MLLFGKVYLELYNSNEDVTWNVKVQKSCELL